MIFEIAQKRILDFARYALMMTVRSGGPVKFSFDELIARAMLGHPHVIGDRKWTRFRSKHDRSLVRGLFFVNGGRHAVQQFREFRAVVCRKLTDKISADERGGASIN